MIPTIDKPTPVQCRNIRTVTRALCESKKNKLDVIKERIAKSTHLNTISPQLSAGFTDEKFGSATISNLVNG